MVQSGDSRTSMRPLVARFCLVTYRQDNDRIVIGADSVARYIATVAKMNLPFPERLVHILNGPPNFRTMAKQ